MDRMSIDQLRRDAVGFAAAVDLLFQMADDDLVIGFRDQEWLGLAPHIEEDVAFGSIGQEEIGHAAYYYQLLEQMGVGRADDLASLRDTETRRNSVLLEQPNGSGHYLESPQYDWGWTIVRHYFHDVWEMTLLNALMESALTPLAEAAHKILGEKRYHQAHQELWMRTMSMSGPVPRTYLCEAVRKAGRWGGDLASLGASAAVLEASRVVPGAPGLKEAFEVRLKSFLDTLDVEWPTWDCPRNGRLGEHTADLKDALATLSEVYRLDPQAQW